MEQRNDRSARSEDVAVAHAYEASAWRSHVGLHEDTLLESLCHAHRVHRLARLVRRNSNNGLNWKIVLLNGADNVFGTLDVRSHRLIWKVFARRNLLQCR